MRGRRRLPVDLRLHGRDARLPAGPARPRHPVGDELPLDAGGARAREQARAAARRRREDAARCSTGGARPGRARVRGPRGRDRLRRRADEGAAPRGRPVRRDRRALPDERALGGVRGGARRRGHPVPRPRGSLPRAPGRPQAPAGASPLLLHRRRGGSAPAGRGTGPAEGAGRRARRVRARAPAGSRPARRASPRSSTTGSAPPPSS